MSKLIIHTDGINNIIIPSLNNAIIHINNALNNIALMSIPSECNINLVSSKTNVEVIKTNLISLKEWCNESITLYLKLEDKYIGEASLLPNNIMSIRQNKIK